MPRNKIARVLVINPSDVDRFLVIDNSLSVALKQGKAATDLIVLPKASYGYEEFQTNEGVVFEHAFKGGVKVKPETGFYIVIVVLDNGSEMYVGTPDLPVFIDCNQRFSDFHSVELSFKWKYDTILRIG